MRWHKVLRDQEHVLEKRRSYLRQQDVRLGQWHKRLEKREQRLGQLNRTREMSPETELDARTGRGIRYLAIFLFNILLFGVFLGAVLFLGDHVVNFLHRIF